MVRAIDRNESILQSNLAERVQQIQQQHSDLQQRYFQVQLNQEKRKQLSKTNAPDESFKAAIEGEEQKKRQRDDQKKRELRPFIDQEDTGDPDQPSHIDIEV